MNFTQLYEMAEPLYCEDNGRRYRGAVQKYTDLASGRAVILAVDDGRGLFQQCVPPVSWAHYVGGNSVFFHGELQLR